jgi:DNA-binding Xre family transcriptional regulator
MTGEELKKIIEEEGYNHTEVAEKLGMSYQNLFRMYKREYIKSSQLKEIVNKLNVTVTKKVYSVVNDSAAPVYNVDVEKYISNLERTINILEADKELLADIIRKKLIDLPDNTKSKAS